MNPGGLFVSSSGIVGIGTAIPNSTLHVSKGGVSFQVTDTNKTTNNTFSVYGLSQTSWAIATGNSGSFSGGEKIVINDNGNIGIGVIPGQKLQVRGTNENAIVRVETTGSGSPSISFTTLGQQDWGIGADYSDSGKLKFDGSTTVGAATKMTLTSAGNLGIGTTGPNANLTVWTSSTTGMQTALRLNNPFGFTNANTGAKIVFSQDRSIAEDYPMGEIGVGQESAGTSASGYMFFGTRNSTISERMRITANGNVGIGTTSPTSPLTVRSTSRTDTLRLSISGSSSTGETTGITFGSSTYDKAQITAYNENSGNAAGYLAFWTGGSPATTDMTERMRITSTGVISINGNSAESNAGLDKFTIGYYVDNWGWLQTWASRPLYLNKLGNAVYAGSVRLDTLSDERIKDNIQPISGSLNKVLQLNGKKFHLKDEPEDKIRYGFIAQDLEGILDEFVINTDMTFTKDDLVVENVKSIENWASSWAALLVEAIKELKSQNDSLQSQIDELKNK
jgi:hypothetical protein